MSLLPALRGSGGDIYAAFFCMNRANTLLARGLPVSTVHDGIGDSSVFVTADL